jgi:hypothetical protein
VEDGVHERDTEVLVVAVACKPVGTAGGTIGAGALLMLIFQFALLLLSHELPPLLKTIAIVVAFAGTV